MKDLIFAPIGMYETWHETCTGAFQHFGLNRFNVNMVVETPTIVSEADMINGIKLALRLMDDVSKEVSLSIQSIFIVRWMKLHQKMITKK